MPSPWNASMSTLILYFISHLLATQRLDDGQCELEAGLQAAAGENQAIPLHEALRVAVMTPIHHFVFGKWVRCNFASKAYPVSQQSRGT